MKTYTELAALPVEAYLNPDNFITDWDKIHEGKDYPKKQYQHGLEIARNAVEVGIAQNGTWYARTKEGGHITSYEGIGYHACTAPLWRGLLTAENVYVYRNGKKVKIK